MPETERSGRTHIYKDQGKKALGVPRAVKLQAWKYDGFLGSRMFVRTQVLGYASTSARGHMSSLYGDALRYKRYHLFDIPCSELWPRITVVWLCSVGVSYQLHATETGSLRR